MKRRNAESGKMRRPLKRTKITEGMYGNSMLYLKFVMLWATVVLADYMLEFRFEFLWPFWMMLRSVYDSFKYQGLAFSVFFICIALTSDMICYFFIPLQYIFFAASTYVWVQYVWYTFADKGICVPTVAVCCLVVWVEGAVRVERGGVGGMGGMGPGVGGAGWGRPLAAHCVGYPAVTLGFGVKSYVGHRLRLRRQRQVRADNEFYFQLMRDALPESALEQHQQSQQPAKEPERSIECDTRHMNGSAGRRRCLKPEQNGHCPLEQADLKFKLDKLEKHLAQQTAARDKSANSSPNSAQTVAQSSAQTSAVANAHAHSNGAPPGHAEDDDKPDQSKGSSKSSKCEKKEASTIKEEKRKNKNRDKDKESCDSHKSTEQTKEQIVKEIESTKESVKNKDCNGYKEKEKDREREKEKEREKEREREREQREKEAKEAREARESRSCSEEVRRLRAEVAAARSGEAEARRALATAAAAERQRRADHLQLKQAHAALQHKVSAWRGSERAAATLERRLGEERRARNHVETQLLRHQQRHARAASGECESEWCRSRASAIETEAATLRRDLQRARDVAAQLQRDLQHARDQVRSLESRQESGALAGAWGALQERATHLERSLSAETRVKLDLLSALGDAKRHMHIQDGLISRQEKEIEELKAQLLAVMPAELTPSLRLPAALDPNASVYTPKQLCSDA
ncbi:unnamed protein product [Chilo suppressalis]|uniref:Macoilin n=1 Tax=Chilo suppressalis TaxID=168631 RepID=A0ABN8AWW3_CHISP|nr:hypothetical protein evm_005474 [Chilo suppressalis]CAH0400738.1 unnamed protein product [Chilo suppressalis]